MCNSAHQGVPCLPSPNPAAPPTVPESVLEKKSLPARDYSSSHSPGSTTLYKSFPFAYGTLLGTATLIRQRVSDITQDNVGVSGFKII